MSIEKFFTKFGGVTEEYRFYNDTIELRYDPKDHVYLLVTPTGELEPQDGVTSVVHIIDKSSALIPWGCKMMAQKIMAAAPITQLPNGDRLLGYLTVEEFEKLVNDGKSAHKEKLEEAANVGHTAHNWIEEYIKSVLAGNDARKFELLAKMPADPRAQNCCIAALDWMQAHNVRWIHTERKIYSRQYKYAGTMDGLAMVDSCSNPECRACRDREPFKDHLTIVDWKSSNYLYLEYLYQTAAYQQAYNEEVEFGRDAQDTQLDWTVKIATDRWVIRLGKEDGEFDPWYAPAGLYQADWNGFKLALDLTRQVAETEARIKEQKDLERKLAKARTDAARAAQDALDKAEKARIKAEKQKARLEALALACERSNKYKGTRPPTCNGGNPCVACTTKYQEVQQSKLKSVLKTGCPCGCGRDLDTACPNRMGRIFHED